MAGKWAGFIAAGILAGIAASAKAETADDWPCVQGKVPELSAAMMWGGPPLPKEAPDWRADPKIRDLVDILSVRRTEMEDAERRIENYVEKLSAEKKARKMSLIFTGLLQKTNTARKDVLQGISRYTRKQRHLVTEIQKQREALEQALQKQSPTSVDDASRREIEQQLNWLTRIYDEREKSLVYVCEIPVLMEQRLFALARVLVNHIE